MRKLLLSLLITVSAISFAVAQDETQTCGVVFGAAVWKDDQPSHALYDRIKAGIDLYDEGEINCLILSGGASTYGSHEADVMKNVAIDEEIPEEDLILDYEGINTEATIRNLPEDVDHFVFISNDFHLSRIALLATKLGVESFETSAATYNEGRYNREKWFRFREFGGNLYTLFFVW